MPGGFSSGFSNGFGNGGGGALLFEIVNTTKSTGGAPATQNIALSKFGGATPKACILWAQAVTATGFTGADAYISFGFADGTNERSISCAIEDGQTTSDTNRRWSNSKGLEIADEGGTILAAADVTFSGDTVTLTWTTNNATAYRIILWVFGGDDISNALAGDFSVATSTGNQTVSGLGFTPTIVLFASNIFTTMDSRINVAMTWGAATSSSARWTTAFHTDDNSGVMDTARWQRTDNCLITISDANGTQEGLADFVSFNSGNFIINWSDAPPAADDVIFMVMDLSDVFVFNETARTTTGTKDSTGAGFDPIGAFLLSYNLVAQSTEQDHLRFTVGGADGTTEGSAWLGDTDALPVSSVDNYVSTAKGMTIVDADAPSSVDGEADVSFITDGMRLDWTNAPATAAQFLGVMFGSAAVGTTRRYSLAMTGVG